VAEHEEWETMYAPGLSVVRIAALCHAPVSTVRHYLQVAVNRNADLGQDHQANQPDPQRPSLEWRNKLDELEAFLAANGRFPLDVALGPRGRTAPGEVDRTATAGRHMTATSTPWTGWATGPPWSANAATTGTGITNSPP